MIINFLPSCFSGGFIRLPVLLVSSCLFVFFFLPSCNTVENDAPEEKTPASDAGLPGGKSLMLDSLHSEIRWTIRRTKGEVLSGVFRPARGMLLLEEHSLVAGFWEGDFFHHNFPEWNQLNAKQSEKEGMKFLKDSIPDLFNAGGRLIRMDLKQVSRVVPKSEFKGSSVQDSLLPSHDVSFLALLADSSQSLRIPLRIREVNKQYLISGQYQVNLREFGILSRMTPNTALDSWLPEVMLNFRLIFRQNTLEQTNKQDKKSN